MQVTLFPVKLISSKLLLLVRSVVNNTTASVVDRSVNCEVRTVDITKLQAGFV